MNPSVLALIGLAIILAAYAVAKKMRHSSNSNLQRSTIPVPTSRELVTAGKTASKSKIGEPVRFHSKRHGWREGIFMGYTRGGRKILVGLWCKNGQDKFQVRRAVAKVEFCNPCA
ncbi:MAG: hypothetical protein WCX12_00505 [Candidatus Paceibacterota bacterium]|jgi:hypothetical protein